LKLSILYQLPKKIEELSYLQHCS